MKASLALVLISLAYSEATQCYRCEDFTRASSAVYSKLEKIGYANIDPSLWCHGVNNKDDIVECDSTECVTMIIESADSHITIQGCVGDTYGPVLTEKTCAEVNGKSGITCTTCTGDLCNTLEDDSIDETSNSCYRCVEITAQNQSRSLTGKLGSVITADQPCHHLQNETYLDIAECDAGVHECAKITERVEGQGTLIARGCKGDRVLIPGFVDTTIDPNFCFNCQYYGCSDLLCNSAVSTQFSLLLLAVIFIKLFLL